MCNPPSVGERLPPRRGPMAAKSTKGRGALCTVSLVQRTSTAWVRRTVHCAWGTGHGAREQGLPRFFFLLAFLAAAGDLQATRSLQEKERVGGLGGSRGSRQLLCDCQLIMDARLFESCVAALRVFTGPRYLRYCAFLPVPARSCAILRDSAGR
jgi:hypothetical protein